MTHARQSAFTLPVFTLLPREIRLTFLWGEHLFGYAGCPGPAVGSARAGGQESAAEEERAESPRVAGGSPCCRTTVACCYLAGPWRPGRWTVRAWVAAPVWLGRCPQRVQRGTWRVNPAHGCIGFVPRRGFFLIELNANFWNPGDVT